MLEGGARRAFGAVGGFTAMQQRGRLSGEDLLRFVELGAFELRQSIDLGKRQLGEQLEEAADIGVFGVPPILSLAIWAEPVWVWPDGG